jgi:hypothetical protein
MPAGVGVFPPAWWPIALSRAVPLFSGSSAVTPESASESMRQFFKRSAFSKG